MKYLLTLFILIITINASTQEVYSAKKCSRLFPGHAHVLITVDTENIHYELFNHWYSLSYAQYRDLIIPLHELQEFNSNNDSIQLEIFDKKVKLVDERYGLKKNVKHQKQCASTEDMRKISYACEITSETNIKHFQLYDREELFLSEEEFEELVDSRLILRLDSCNNIHLYR